MSNLSKVPVPEEHQLHQAYDIEEDIERAKYHYDQDPRFFYRLTGGTWHVYSCLLWENEDTTPTQAQEAKLDLLAQGMGLKPGMRILDVGCGWGGPLVYLCKRYGVTGVGIMLNEQQREAAAMRAADNGVNATFHVAHWKTFGKAEEFDAIYSDEVQAHIPSLPEFYRHSWELLKMGGRLVNKELHYTHSRHSIFGRTGEAVHAVFNFSGHYVLLADEMKALDDAGFEIVALHHLPMSNYHRTLDFWLNNMHTYQDELKAVSDEAFYKACRKYLKIVRRLFTTNAMMMDIVVSQKIDPNEHA